MNGIDLRGQRSRQRVQLPLILGHVRLRLVQPANSPPLQIPLRRQAGHCDGIRVRSQYQRAAADLNIDRAIGIVLNADISKRGKLVQKQAAPVQQRVRLLPLHGFLLDGDVQSGDLLPIVVMD